MLNISKMATDMGIVTMEGVYTLYILCWHTHIYIKFKTRVKNSKSKH